MIDRYLNEPEKKVYRSIITHNILVVYVHRTALALAHYQALRSTPSNTQINKSSDELQDVYVYRIECCSANVCSFAVGLVLGALDQ